uniref:AB hydrolase-1 domain-containing protein n=1 Tax=Plectus sambesii TaxID=2011161 RepID=A0A914UI71_9BILA
MNDYVRLAFTLASSIFWTAVMIVWMGIQVFKHKMDFFTQKKRERPPKVLDGWNHDSVKLSDVTLHYVHAGSTDKPLMLMVHGFPEFWYSWRYQIRHFQSKYRVVAVDLRGYNESDKPSGIANYSAARIGQDLQELVIALGYKSCVLLAHDWGGAIAWGVAARYPEIVDRLVICNCPHPKGMQKAIQSDRGQLLKSWYMFFFQCPILPELMFK